MRIIHCPANVGGQPWGLRHAEAQLGHDSQVVVYDQTSFRYGLDRLIMKPEDSLLRREFRRWGFLMDLLVTPPDFVHFNFGQKILAHPARWRKHGDSGSQKIGRLLYAAYSRMFASMDIRALRSRGTRCAVTFQGDDIRQGDFCRQTYDVHFAHEVGPDYYDDDSDQRKRNVVRFWDRFADHLYTLNPDLLRVLPERAKFLPYAHVRASEWPCCLPEPKSCPVIVHAPTHRTVKGTKYLIAAVEQLRSEGVSLELRLIEGLSHEEALREYEKADIVVDQLLAGWFGGLAVEVMAMGKPVIAYIREDDLPWVPEKYRHAIPVINAGPESVTSVLRDLLAHPSEWAERGRRGRAFVEKWHDPLKIADQILQDAKTRS